MLKLLRGNFFLIIIPIAVLLTFWNLPSTFYQQDEWQTLGHNLIQGIRNITYYSNPIQLLFAEGRPLSRALDLILLGFYKFNLLPFAIFSLVFHSLNSLLLFYLAKKITKNFLISFVASVFFIVNSVSSQGETWASAAGTLPATALILLSIIFYFNFLEGKKVFIYYSFAAVLLSLFFKETGLFLFVLLPFIYWLNKKGTSFLNIIKVHYPLLLYGVALVFFRLSELLFSTQKIAGFETGNQNFIQSVLFHSILYPLTSLFQVFIPPLDLYSFTGIITRIQYKFLIGSPLIDLVGQSVVTDMVSIIGSLFIFLILLLIIYKNKESKKNILFALLFFFLSFFPYAVLYREGSYLSSRYFYVGAAAAGILFGYSINYLISFGKRIKWIILVLVFAYLFHHASIIRSDINYQVNLGNQRKAVLNGIKNIYPNLEKNSIFYVTSDKGYYGDITNPFQNGLGYVLEVWYYSSGKIPKKFLSDNFLWDLGSEGYKRSEDNGFGYYQNLDKMVSDMRINKFKISQIHAFFIRSSDTKVLNITNEIKDKISTVSAIPK